MRHVRMLGVLLAALFVVSAIAAVPALAKKTHVPGTLEGEWKPYLHCPLDSTEFMNKEVGEFHGTNPDESSSLLACPTRTLRTGAPG